MANQETRPQASKERAFWKVIRRFGGAFASLGNWCWGDVPDKADAKDDGLREIITLLGFFLLWQAALLAYVQTNPKPTLRVGAVYVIVSLLPLMGMFRISLVDTLKPWHRRIGWSLALAAACLTVGLGSAYALKWLPNQFVNGTYLDTGTPYLGVNVEREALPLGAVTWKASLSERAGKYWRIDQVRCYRDKERSDAIACRKDSSLSTPASAVGSFNGQSGLKYYFRLELEQVGAEPPSFAFSTEDLTFEIAP